MSLRLEATRKCPEQGRIQHRENATLHPTSPRSLVDPVRPSHRKLFEWEDVSCSLCKTLPSCLHHASSSEHPRSLQRLTLRPNVCVHHHDHQFFKGYFWLPSQHALGLRGIADEEIDFRRLVVAGIDFHIVMPSQPHMACTSSPANLGVCGVEYFTMSPLRARRIFLHREEHQVNAPHQNATSRNA